MIQIEIRSICATTDTSIMSYSFIQTLIDNKINLYYYNLQSAIRGGLQ